MSGGPDSERALGGTGAHPSSRQPPPPAEHLGLSAAEDSDRPTRDRVVLRPDDVLTLRTADGETVLGYSVKRSLLSTRNGPQRRHSMGDPMDLKPALDFVRAEREQVSKSARSMLQFLLLGCATS
jgi:hypothetical protein